MTHTHPKETNDRELIEEMEKLEDAVRASVIPIYKQVFRGFLTGISTTLGALVAAAIIIPIMLLLLQNVQWVPLIGTFVQRISDYTQHAR